jgi:hypothetical protein
MSAAPAPAAEPPSGLSDDPGQPGNTVPSDTEPPSDTGQSGTGQPDTGQPSKGVAVPVAVGVVVAAIVAVFAIVGLVVSLTDDRLPTGPAMAPPAAAGPEVSYDSLLRRARFGDVVVSMPGVPYECPTAPGEAPPILTSGLVCNATVHAKYNGTDDWTATAGFGAITEALTKPTAEDTAEAVFQQLLTTAFSNQQTTVRNQQTEEVDLTGNPVSTVSGEVHYSVDGVPSSYDRMLVIVLPIEGGGYAVYFSSRPNDTPEATLDVLNRSINTLRYDE